MKQLNSDDGVFTTSPQACSFEVWAWVYTRVYLYRACAWERDTHRTNGAITVTIKITCCVWWVCATEQCIVDIKLIIESETKRRVSRQRCLSRPLRPQLTQLRHIPNHQNTSHRHLSQTPLFKLLTSLSALVSKRTLFPKTQAPDYSLPAFVPVYYYELPSHVFSPRFLPSFHVS